MLLVIGNAAHADLIARADRVPPSHTVGRLLSGSAKHGKWLPGGSAPTVALVASEYHDHVRLWHPLPAGAGHTFGLSDLREARVDLTMCPLVEDANYCVLVEAADQRLCWSTSPSSTDVSDPTSLLSDIEVVVVCPEWGPWVESVLEVAIESGIATALVGEIPQAATRYEWNYVIANREQVAEASNLRARVLVTTNGSEGAEIRSFGQGLVQLDAVPVDAIDTTGAGDTFAGAFLGGLMAGSSLQAAGAEASARAAEACLVWGARSGRPRLRPTADIAERALGALAGIACGDAFGMPNSFLQQPEWRTEMEAGPAHSLYHAGYEPGRVTDDTEQALALTNSLRRSGGRLDPRIAADELLAWFESVGGETSLAVGPSTMRAMLAYRAGAPLDEVGATGVTNGAPMRIAPIGVWAALADLDEEVFADEVATACLPTHNTSIAISGACAVAFAVYSGIRGEPWADALKFALRGADIGATRGKWVYAPSVSQRISWACDVVLEARNDREAADIIGELIGAGEPVTQSVPAAFAAATYAAGDPERAIVVSGNVRGDTDTVAAIAGALAGAQAGLQAFPPAWIDLVAEVNNIELDAWYRDLAAAALGVASASNDDPGSTPLAFDTEAGE